MWSQCTHILDWLCLCIIMYVTVTHDWKCHIIFFSFDCIFRYITSFLQHDQTLKSDRHLNSSHFYENSTLIMIFNLKRIKLLWTFASLRPSGWAVPMPADDWHQKAGIASFSYIFSGALQTAWPPNVDVSFTPPGIQSWFLQLSCFCDWWLDHILLCQKNIHEVWFSNANLSWVF